MKCDAWTLADGSFSLGRGTQGAPAEGSLAVELVEYLGELLGPSWNTGLD
ncbi:MAG: hypothetical protein ACYCYF_02595 [Anaerolineae bacterium]